MTDIDVKEYPEGHKGRKSYVFVPGAGVVAACYTCHVGGALQLLPEYGGPEIKSNRTGTFHIIGEIGAYTSPVDGTFVGTRDAHREHIRRHDLIEVGNERVGHMDKPQDSGHRAGQDIKQALQRAKQG